jgi:hypothetical protein
VHTWSRLKLKLTHLRVRAHLRRAELHRVLARRGLLWRRGSERRPNSTATRRALRPTRRQAMRAAHAATGNACGPRVDRQCVRRWRRQAMRAALAVRGWECVAVFRMPLMHVARERGWQLAVAGYACGCGCSCGYGQWLVRGRGEPRTGVCYNVVRV